MTTPTAEEYADEMLIALGPDGEHWYQGDAFSVDGTRMCVLGAAEKARSSLARRHYLPHGGGSPLAKKLNGVYETTVNRINVFAVAAYPMRATPDDDCPIISINDHPETTFPDIRVVLEKARASLAEEGL